MTINMNEKDNRNISEMSDFGALYDYKDEYIFRRLPESYNAKRIELEVKYFKIPNLLKVLPDNFKYQTIVEIGCATGEIIGTFPGADIKRRVGFDISPLNLECAKLRFPNTEFKNMDFRSCDENFDILILSDILEHVPDNIDFLKDAARMAKLILINLPIEKCPINRFRKYGPNDPSGHLVAFSIKDALNIFECADLSILKSSRKWSMESEYELLRQELNKKTHGKRFTGNLVQQRIKAFVIFFITHFKMFGRFLFPSNLFVAAIKKDSEK